MFLSEADDAVNVEWRQVFNGPPIGIFEWAADSVVAQELTFPFTLIPVSRHGDIGQTLQPKGREFADVMLSGSTANWVVGATVRLDPSITLVWLNNLRALNRLALLVDVTSGSVLRAQLVTQPVGIVHEIPGAKGFLLGSHEIPHGRQLIVYRTNWSDHRGPHQSETSINERTRAVRSRQQLRRKYVQTKYS
jgi:hypothetical protein